MILTEEPKTPNSLVYSKFILKNGGNEQSSKDNTYNNISYDYNIRQNPVIKRNKDHQIIIDNNKMKSRKINQETKEFIDILNCSKSFIKEEITTTKIYLKNKKEGKLFFEILYWMYSKDAKVLKKFSKDFEILLHLLSLGLFLKMKKEYFKMLLSDLKIDWEKNLFNLPIWTRDKLSFHVLEKIIPLISPNYLRIYALISWLKSTESNSDKIVEDKNIKNKSLKSKDLFLVRNYIKKYKLLSNLSKDELVDLKNNFEEYIDCLDMNGILLNYLFIPLTCIICKTVFHSTYDVLNEKTCTNNQYHPICGPIDNCQHKECKKRFKKGEYYCCHKKLTEKDSGCLTGEGKHIFILYNPKKTNNH